MVQRRLRILVILSISCVLLLSFGFAGWMRVLASGSASISLSPTSGPPASSVSVSGTGFKGNETVSVLFDAAQVGSAKAGASGAFTSQITVPSTALPGNHTIKAVGQRSGKSAQAPFTVVQMAQGDWEMYGFDAGHTGANPYEHILSTSNVANLSIAWSAPLTNMTSWSSVAVAGGMVFSQTNQLNAYDATTGTLLWTANISGNTGPASSPAVANGIVYVSSYTGSLYALDAQTGAIIWTHAVTNALPSQSALSVANGLVYEGWNDGYLYAFDAQTGAQLWRFFTATNIYSSPSVVSGILYLTAGSLLYALDASTGAQLWSYSLGSNPSTPAVTNGVVYVAAGSTNSNNLYALDATSGALLWSASTGVPLISTYCSLAVASGMIYLYNGDVYAFSASTGAAMWHSSTGNPPTNPASSPIVANGVVYTGSDASTFYAYDAQTGALLWSYSFPGSNADVTPVVSNGMLYVVSGSNPPMLYAFH